MKPTRAILDGIARLDAEGRVKYPRGFVPASPPPELMDWQQFTEAVIGVAQALGWRVAHFRPARTAKGWRTAVSGDGKGFPDLLLARGDRLIVAELKTGRGRLTREQRAWLDAFAAVPGVTACVWRPKSWAEMVELLT
jgi:hypothetical protein